MFFPKYMKVKSDLREKEEMRAKNISRENVIGFKRSTTKSIIIKSYTEEEPKLSNVQKDLPKLHYRNQKSVIVTSKHAISKNNHILKQCLNELDKFVLSI
jgi:hypothetical protein